MIDVERTWPAPASLAKQSDGCWRAEDVRQQLDLDFHAKCYLCEGPLLGEFEVEHLRPRAHFEAHRHDWANLFPAHGQRCNNRRKHWEKTGDAEQRDGQAIRWPVGGLLDPARPGEQVELRLVQRWEAHPSRKGDLRIIFLPRDATDRAAHNTAAELAHIHNAGIQWAQQLRRDINDAWGDIQRRTLEALEAHIVGDDLAFAMACRSLREDLLAPSAPYAALMRRRFVDTTRPETIALLGLADTLPDP